MNEGSKFFDDLGKLMNEAAGVADGARREVETVFRGQMERFVNDMNLVKREDYDALRELVQAQSADIAQLRKDVTSLKTRKKPS